MQLGLTATPKRKDNVDTYAYFCEPVFVYSLKEGINDGFLAPFKVKQISTTLDEYVWTPDDVVMEGEVELGKRYGEGDFNKKIEICERERKRAEIFLSQIDQREKTLVFCASQEHALLVRDMINQIKTSTDPNYCQRVTAGGGCPRTNDQGKPNGKFLVFRPVAPEPAQGVGEDRGAVARAVAAGAEDKLMVVAGEL